MTFNLYILIEMGNESFTVTNLLLPYQVESHVNILDKSVVHK